MSGLAVEPRLPGQTWLIGCGKMVGAMVAGWRSAGLDLGPAIAVRPSGAPVPGVRTSAALPEQEGPPRLAILGFKPQQLGSVAPTLAPLLGRDTLIVSILAGVEAASLRDCFPLAGTIIRAMPNLPVEQHQGIIALYSSEADEEARALLGDLFGLLGLALWTEQESDIGAVTAIAGSGPAYVARFVAALAAAGRRHGLAPELADRIALQTVGGAAAMAAARGEAMAELAARVASPGGTTEAGLSVLDQHGALDRLVGQAIDAAIDRGGELAAAARRSERG